MKMKKYLTLGLSGIAIIAMVACSPKVTSNENSKGEGISQNNTSQDGSNGNENSEELTYLGKVKKIVGNEIEIELAKDQEVSGNGSNIPDGSFFKESIGGDSDSIPEGAQSLTDGGGESFQGSINMAGGEGAEVFSFSDMEDKKLELEYTGETIKVMIPAGAKIFDMRSGSDSKLSVIKANSIIKIFATGTKENPVVKSVDIVE